MTTLNLQSRTVNNSNGRCLLENWVEERQVQELKIEKELEKNDENTNTTLHFKDGHPGILTTDAEQDKLTTFSHSYKVPEKPKVRTTGAKRELLEKTLYAKVSQEVQEEFDVPPPETEYNSVTRKDFDVDGFVSQHPPPKHEHNVETEQPVTFWSEHKDKIHGVSQQKTYNAPFKKNSSFSKPIEEQWDQPKPYELEQHPWM
ncbi:Sperm-associated antigen 8 [Holothuria leucospilota]|uniref:Sperm-associated antigen 8 n=1 Tax=Holothuria leucospilota TaxID=206669 RepID=A0A9Q1BN32_HOLLE|nr:Sperm-associated antigen 8 [Holothuria leucospilota]